MRIGEPRQEITTLCVECSSKMRVREPRQEITTLCVKCSSKILAAVAITLQKICSSSENQHERLGSPFYLNAENLKSGSSSAGQRLYIKIYTAPHVWVPGYKKADIRFDTIFKPNESNL